MGVRLNGIDGSSKCICLYVFEKDCLSFYLFECMCLREMDEAYLFE